jgi:hypothetical protein
MSAKVLKELKGPVLLVVAIGVAACVRGNVTESTLVGCYSSARPSFSEFLQLLPDKSYAYDYSVRGRPLRHSVNRLAHWSVMYETQSGDASVVLENFSAPAWEDMRVRKVKGPQNSEKQAPIPPFTLILGVERSGGKLRLVRSPDEGYEYVSTPCRF